MDVSILVTDPQHPVVHVLQEWAFKMNSSGHTVSIFHDKRDMPGGDILFLVSCSQVVREDERNKYGAVLVLHASDLPSRRGWSPYIWAVLDGDDQITVSLLEAKEPVDSGAVWLKTQFKLGGHELLSEINAKLFDAEIDLMSQAVDQFTAITPQPQRGAPGAYMRKRSPEDSRLDPNKSLSEQFDLLRVVDNQRYPAFFDHLGKRYLIKIERDKNEH